MAVELRIQDRSVTHVGHVRSENEDALIGVAAQAMWAVADGMGGHENGRMASQAIAEHLAATILPQDLGPACDTLAGAIHVANRAIFDHAREAGVQMGSTIVALVLRGREFAVLWAGDSRAYLFRDGQLIRLTRDHTQVEDMVERGLLSAEEASDHPMKHVLSRAVGVMETLEIDAIADEAQSKDMFLLCSDGLTGVVDEQTIAAILAEGAGDAVDRLLQATLDGGAPDNVTIALVEVSEPTLLVLNGAGA